MMLSIYLLGQPHLSWNGEALAFNAPPRTLPLLAYLLIHRNQVLDRLQVAMQIWPDVSEQDARTNLRRHLHWLGKALPEVQPEKPWLISTSNTLRWNAESPYWLDIEAFENFAQNPDTYPQAVALYQGSLLENLYDDWIFLEQERLRGQYHQILNQLIIQKRGQCAYAEAIQFAKLLLAQDPFREDTVRQLVALRYESGDRAGALAEYEHFVTQLDQEMGVPPMPETQALYERVLRDKGLPQPRPEGDDGEDRPAARPKNDLLPFVGRQTQLDHLAARWTKAVHGQGGLMLVSGEAGIGKTRLLRELALVVESQGGRILRGGTSPLEEMPYQCFVEAFQGVLPLLASLDGEPARLAALAAFVPELRKRRKLPALTPLDPEQERIRLFDAVAGCLEKLAGPRPVLLLLEDLHWAGDSTVALLEYLVFSLARQPVLLVATCREEEVGRGAKLRTARRKLEGEGLSDLLALDCLDRAAVSDLLERAASQGKSDAGSGPDEAWQERLYRASDGNPLFLSVWLSQWKDKELDFESSIPQDLTRVIEQRLSRLSATGRAFAEVAAVLGQHFDPLAAGEVGGWRESQALDALNEMLDSRLVRDVDKNVDYRFSHNLIQTVLYQSIPPLKLRARHRRAGEVLEELYPERRDELCTLLAHHFDRGGARLKAMAYYKLSAQAAAKVYAVDSALQMLARAQELADAPGEDPVSAGERLEQALMAAELHHQTGDREGQAQDVARLDQLAAADLDWEHRRQAALQKIIYLHAVDQRDEEWAALQAFRQLAEGDVYWQAMSAMREGYYFELVSDFQAAIAAFQKGMDLFAALEKRKEEQQCAVRIAATYIFLRNADQIDAWMEKARAYHGKGQVTTATLDLLYIASVNARNRENLPLALKYAHELIDLSEKIQSINNLGIGHRLCGQMYSGQFKVREAYHHFHAALAIFKRIRNLNSWAATLGGLAALALDLGRYQEAWDTYSEALAMTIQVGSLDMQARECINLGYTASFLGNYAAEKEYSLKAIDLGRRLQSPFLEAHALTNLGEAERELGHIPEAVTALLASAACYQTAKRNDSEALIDLALTYLAGHDLPAARQVAEKLEEKLTGRVNSASDAQRQMWAAACVWLADGQDERARTLLEQAYEMVERKCADIPDAESRKTFRQIIYNRQIIHFHETGSLK
ncbi:MAG TPA: AAA family ATPase [Anaerolineaceae bacterium]|nr:AAA family ATPase [Anaerolineaceae bacterium]HPN52870.1 AAA family ATPase [Anaerolineaceae bacterium]